MNSKSDIGRVGFDALVVAVVGNPFTVFGLRPRVGPAGEGENGGGEDGEVHFDRINIYGDWLR